MLYDLISLSLAGNLGSALTLLGHGKFKLCGVGAEIRNEPRVRRKIEMVAFEKPFFVKNLGGAVRLACESFREILAFARQPNEII
jgi:hypothetical protein